MKKMWSISAFEFCGLATLIDTKEVVATGIVQEITLC